MIEPFAIKSVAFKNRVLRSSMGGKMSYYDGRVSPTWVQFEKRFADHGVAGILSTTFTVDERRWAPLQYPKISHDRFIAPLREGVRAIQALDCRYLLQIGDAGYHTQTSLSADHQDCETASGGFDLLFGYGNWRRAMTVERIEREVEQFAAGARRAREAGCDGVEIAAHKGYLIHQFLNPAINRRTDRYGGSVEKRFQFLREIIIAVRRAVGDDYLVGVRLAAEDGNHLPVNLRWPLVFPLRHYFQGNGLAETLAYGRELARLGVDFLHITRGFGFIHPWESVGAWPVDEFRLFANSGRHLSGKANVRAAVLNGLPRPIARALFGRGWRYLPAPNAEVAALFRQQTGLPVIANGGFDRRDHIELALATGQCDLVGIARPLLANPDLLSVFAAGRNEPERPCTHCNRCSVATATLPLGCYDRSRFASQDQMEEQIMWWSGGPDSTATAAAPPGSV